jgi:heat shock protein HslJ
MKYPILFLFGLILIIRCTSSNQTEQVGDIKNTKTEGAIVHPSFYQNKFMNGTDFFVRGNEPSWNLEIDFEKSMKFSALNDINLITPSVEGVKAQDADVTSFRSQTDTAEMIVTIIKEDCEDNMSGGPFNYKVRVEIKNSGDKEFKTFEGCGKYLYDFRLNDIWVMEEMTGVELKKENLMKGFPTFEFNLKERRISGHAGCNNLMAKIKLKGNEIIFGNFAATMMACPDMEVERAVVDALNNKTFNYKIGNLKLTLENKSIKMVFKKVD